MPEHTNDYDIIITAQISLGGKYTAPLRAVAIEMARMELRAHGVLENISTERCIVLVDDAPDADTPIKGKGLPDAPDPVAAAPVDSSYTDAELDKMADLLDGAYGGAQNDF